MDVHANPDLYQLLIETAQQVTAHRDANPHPLPESAFEHLAAVERLPVIQNK